MAEYGQGSREAHCNEMSLRSTSRRSPCETPGFEYRGRVPAPSGHPSRSVLALSVGSGQRLSGAVPMTSSPKASRSGRRSRRERDTAPRSNLLVFEHDWTLPAHAVRVRHPPVWGMPRCHACEAPADQPHRDSGELPFQRVLADRHAQCRRGRLARRIHSEVQWALRRPGELA